VQGVIDCLFSENGGLVIVDYKTGWFDASDYENEAERIRSAYGEQLRLYRRAAELIFEKPVIESVVYMTRVGVTVEII
jgi:ATP-dependent helicase/nuclease subunit A